MATIDELIKELEERRAALAASGLAPDPTPLDIDRAITAAVVAANKFACLSEREPLSPHDHAHFHRLAEIFQKNLVAAAAPAGTYRGHKLDKLLGEMSPESKEMYRNLPRSSVPR